MTCFLNLALKGILSNFDKYIPVIINIIPKIWATIEVLLLKLKSIRTLDIICPLITSKAVLLLLF